MAQMPIHVADFNGTEGPMTARIFVQDMDAAMAAGNFTPQRMAGVFKSKLKGDARTWLTAKQGRGVAGFDNWETIKPQFEAEYLVPLTVAQLNQIAKTLVQKGNEAVGAFYNRVEVFHIDQDFRLTAAEKATAGYEASFERRVRNVFLTGLRREVLQAMSSVDVHEAPLEDVIKAAKNAETLTMSKSVDSIKTATTSAASEEEKSAATMAALVVAAVNKELARLGLNNGGASGASSAPGGRKRGGGNGAGQGGQKPRRAGPPREVLNARTAEYCHGCGKVVKHRPEECWTLLDRLAAQKGGAAANAVSADAVEAGYIGQEQLLPFDAPLNC